MFEKEKAEVSTYLATYSNYFFQLEKRQNKQNNVIFSYKEMTIYKITQYFK